MAQPRDGKIVEIESERRVEPALSATADGLDGGSKCRSVLAQLPLTEPLTRPLQAPR